MKLAAVLFKYFPNGGLQRDFFRTMEEARRRGHEIHVFAIKWDGDVPAWLNLHLVRVHAVSNHQSAKQFFRKLPAALKTVKPDLVFGFNRGPGLDVYFAADDCFKLLSAAKHSGFFNLFSSRNRTFVNMEGTIFQPESKTEILCLTEHQTARFVHAWGTPRTRMHLVPPGMNPECVYSEKSAEIRKSVRESLNIPSDQFVLIHAGMNLPLKGADRVIRAVAALPPEIREKTTTLIFGTPVKQLVRQSAAVQADIRFKGVADSLAEWLFASDIMIHPARSEAAGSVIVESLASGVPVICTDNCGFASFVRSSAAGCVIPGTPFQQSQLNAALLSFFARQNTIALLKNRALEFAGTHKLNGRAEAIVDFIEKAAHAKNCHHSAV